MKKLNAFANMNDVFVKNIYRKKIFINTNFRQMAAIFTLKCFEQKNRRDQAPKYLKKKPFINSPKIILTSTL